MPTTQPVTIPTKDDLLKDWNDMPSTIKIDGRGHVVVSPMKCPKFWQLVSRTMVYFVSNYK